MSASAGEAQTPASWARERWELGLAPVACFLAHRPTDHLLVTEQVTGLTWAWVRRGGRAHPWAWWLQTLPGWAAVPMHSSPTVAGRPQGTQGAGVTAVPAERRRSSQREGRGLTWMESVGSGEEEGTSFRRGSVP